MWSIKDVSPEQLAKLVHYYQGALSKDSEIRCVEDCTSSWEHATQHDREVMVSAARLALMELATHPVQRLSRKYFAEPGEAEWGC